MMYRSVCLASLVVASLFVLVHSPVGAAVERSASVQLESQWTQYKAEYGKRYRNDEEDAMRRSIWEANLDFIATQNARADRGEITYRLGVNRFADLRTKEYRQRFGYGGNKTFDWRSLNASVDSNRSMCTHAEYRRTMSLFHLPSSVNWVDKGWVNPVQDQGECGDCWAFSACGALEGQYYNVTGTSVILSEQNLLECSGPEGNGNCTAGGWMDDAFCYVMLNGGLDPASSYPYEAADWVTSPPVDTCKYSAANSVLTITGYSNVLHDSEGSLQQAVALVGPVSVAINAGLPSFQFYSSGVYSDPACTPGTDHAVLAVGYGTTDSGQQYWLLKNSWGTSWGQEGYMMLARFDDNLCGIASYASFPTGLQPTSLMTLSAPSSFLPVLSDSMALLSGLIIGLALRHG